MKKGWNLDRLAESLQRTNGVFQEPVLPHLIGVAYWQRGESESAIRFWKAAIRHSPSFAPSHLNLAFAAFENSITETASKELYLASVLNVQDTFGIDRHIIELRRRLGAVSGEAFVYDERDYLPAVANDSQSQRIVDVYSSIHELADSPADRAACWNNVGVYFMEIRGEPALAIDYFLHSQQELVGPAEILGGEIASTILDNLIRCAESAGLVEAELFRQIRDGKQ